MVQDSWQADKKSYDLSNAVNVRRDESPSCGCDPQ